MTEAVLHRLAAFAETAGGGNPAGVWIGDAHPDAAQMQQIASDVGYSETAFIAPASGRAREVRYFSPAAEVPFCGHATIASGAVVGRHDGTGRFEFETAAGRVPVQVEDRDGRLYVSLTSVEPRQKSVSASDLNDVLPILGWNRAALDPELPPCVAYAGAWHLVIGVRERNTLAQLDYGFEALRTFMLERDLTTLQLVWRESRESFHSRNPFPPGGVVEDPATGAAAAALGGYLRAARLVATPARITVVQGADMGRPSRIHVRIPEAGGIVVAGTVAYLEPGPG